MLDAILYGTGSNLHLADLEGRKGVAIDLIIRPAKTRQCPVLAVIALSRLNSTGRNGIYNGRRWPVVTGYSKN